MRTFGKLRFGALASASVMAVLLGTGCATGSAQTETVTIAAYLELSGEGAAQGTIYRDALELRVEQVNEQRLLGDRRLELVVHDNRSDSAAAPSDLAALATDPDITAIITGGCADCLLAAVDTINEVGVPTISLAAPDTIAAPVEQRRFVFKLGPNAADSATALASTLSRSSISTVAVLASDDAYGQEGLRHLGGALDRAGVELVLDESITDDPELLQDAAEQVVSYRPDPDPGFVGVPGGFAEEPASAAPDAVIVWAAAPTAAAAAMHLREEGFDGDLFLDMAAADSLFLSDTAAAALDGATMVFTETLVIDEVIATSPAKTARKSWFDAYSARYGTYHAFASFAADAVQLIVEAINTADSTDRESVRLGIEIARLDGLTGPLRMTPNHHSGLMSQGLTTVVVRGDRWRLAG